MFWAEIPVFPSEWQPVYLAALLALSASLAVCANLVSRHVGLAVCRKLSLLAGLQVAVAGLRLVELGIGVGGRGVLIAAHSLLDLVLGGLLVVGVRRLHQQHRLSLGSLMLLGGLGLSALFWGLLGGERHQPLLASNGLAGGSQLAFYGFVTVCLFRILVAELGHRHRQAEARVSELSLANASLQHELAEASEMATEQARLYGAQKAETGRLRHRSRAIEKTLAIATRLCATRELSELQERVVQAVTELHGDRRVLLRLYSPPTQAFEARAFAGVSDQEKTALTGSQVSLADYRSLTQARHQISNGYYFDGESPFDDAVGDCNVGSQPDPSPKMDWKEGDFLLLPLITASGETKGYLSLAEPAAGRVPPLHDVRQLEFIVRQAAAAIEAIETCDRLAEKNAELARASEMISNLAEMKANFVANVSHELRTPLTSITAYTELLQQDADGMSDEVRGEFLRVINKESDKLSHIIDDILELSRMENRGARSDRREIDLAALVRRLEETARQRARSEDVRLTVQLPPGDIKLQADAVLLQQLLDHLLSNAFKFTPAGGSVRLVVVDDGAAVRILVEDSGIGIPEEKMRYIFDRFYQADGSSTRQHGGQGVGLAICHDIVRYHEGRLWAENVSPSGARFQVVLPRRGQVIQRLGAEATDWTLNEPAEFMEQLVHWISEIMAVEIVSLLLPDEAGEYLEIRAAVGLPASVVQSERLRRGAGIAGKVWASGRTLHVTDIVADGRLGKRVNNPRYTTPSLLSVPLQVGMEVVGVVNANNRRDGRPLDERDRLLLEALAPRISHLLGQARAHHENVHHFAVLLEALRATISLHRDRYDELSTLCQEICLATARRMKLPRPELEHLAFALQYYDVGLTRISDQLLRKRTPLTPDERKEINKHVAASLEILAPLRISPKARQIILHHHERYDGGGHPDGLEGEAIPLGARLLNLCDSLNAMLHERPYRSRLSFAETVAEIGNEAGAQFCPRLTGPFLAEAEVYQEHIERLQAAAAVAGQVIDPAPSPASRQEPRPALVPASSDSSRRR